MVCQAGCQGNPETTATCPDGIVGWSQAICVVYMCLSVGGQLTV